MNPHMHCCDEGLDGKGDFRERLPRFANYNRNFGLRLCECTATMFLHKWGKVEALTT